MDTVISTVVRGLTLYKALRSVISGTAIIITDDGSNKVSGIIGSKISLERVRAIIETYNRQIRQPQPKTKIGGTMIYGQN